MCLIFLSLDCHPTYKLIVVANRDEFYSRKTAPAQFWKDHPDVLGGRDLEAGGTWMGVSKSGSVSMVTNYRDPKNINPSAPSRGHLVSDFLMNDEDPLEYLGWVERSGYQYNGFNLIVGKKSDLYYYSNYKEVIEKITPGIHGLSNHFLDTPWPKVTAGVNKMRPLMEEKDPDPDALLNAIYDDTIAQDHELPDTGIGLERERWLSAMFIKSPGYGSRSSTVLMIDRSDHVVFVERVYDTASFDYTTSTFSFKLAGSNS